ncbi:hypothetical protein BJ988_001710 [Nocardioides panzhihuensis]|uniref:Uncharacterized protein n=1 Tax=Nocardioides panzhihuensis TaxID=860243 RepID=A0A7Z0IRU1_9ACTN|nr:hypothetical protein [Nocardioides panzhihuensis]
MREHGAVSQPVAVIVAFARDYPGGGFTIDDEPGSTLTLLLVVRNELEACDPTQIPQLDEFIPQAYRVR